jgi:hypothetical protein
MERSTMQFMNGKPAISMGHGFHGKLLNYQRVPHLLVGVVGPTPLGFYMTCLCENGRSRMPCYPVVDNIAIFEIEMG